MHQTCDQNVPPHLIEEIHHLCHRVVSVSTPLAFSVFEYLQWYPTCFEVERFCLMRSDGNELLCGMF